jgi:hypothetical protein
MKGITIGLLAGLALGWRTAAAEDWTPPALRLERASIDLDMDSDSPDGQKLVVSKLKSRFKVDDALIRSLSADKLSNGEIAIVLALARRMPGEINGANVKKIMTLRQGPPVLHWGAVAEKLGVSVRRVLRDVRRVDWDLLRAERQYRR